MNIIDIIILAILAYALFSGAREGVIVQVCSLLGIVLGLYLGSTYSDSAADFFGVKGEYRLMIGYAIVVVATILVVVVTANLVRGVLKIAGLGIFDSILGVVLSLCKYLLIMSVLFRVFNGVNGVFNIFSDKELARSKFYYPIADITEWITPAWDWTKEQWEQLEGSEPVKELEKIKTI
ncbi:MAG: CvpA family protein [Rikenellaceae bacterium]